LKALQMMFVKGLSKKKISKLTYIHHNISQDSFNIYFLEKIGFCNLIHQPAKQAELKSRFLLDNIRDTAA